MVARAAAFEACGGGLAGGEERYVVAWTIDPQGAVSAEHATVVPAGRRDVGACLEREVRRLAFPRPKGGAIVKVSFPFVFGGVA